MFYTNCCFVDLAEEQARSQHQVKFFLNKGYSGKLSVTKSGENH